MDEYLYHPSRIARYLRMWPEIQALAANPATARGLLVKGPTPESPKAGTRQRGYRGHRQAWADVVADLERARAEALIPFGLEWHVVEAQTRGWSINRYSAATRLGNERCWKAFHEACRLMAVYLGWSEEAPSD